MTERDERHELTPPLATNGKKKLSTSRRGIMKAMALTTVGTAAASIYLPTASAAPPEGKDDGQGGIKKAATFPTTPGFTYRSYTGADFHSESNANDNAYDGDGAIHAIGVASAWVLYLDLPNGAVIREVVLFYIDNDAVNNIEGRLVRYDPTTETSVQVANFISTGASTGVKADPLVLNAPGPFPTSVDTTTFAYRIRVLLPLSTTVLLVGVRVGFTNAGVFTFLSTPERFVDTRAGAGNIGGVTGPLAPNTTKTFQMTGRNGSSGNPALQIPDAATAIVGTLTAVGTAASLPGSFLTIWPGGVQPTVSSVNYGPPPTSVLATQFSTGLTLVGGHGNVNVFNRSEADYLIDVIGYYS